MTVKYLILVKHSLPEIVESIPAREWRLSEEGRQRAQRLAEQLSDYSPDVIVSSKEPKAIETAEIIAGKFRLTNHVFEGLHEYDRSNVPFLTRDQFLSAIKRFLEKPNELVFGNETADRAYNRFKQAVQSVRTSFPNKNIVLVAHGTVISLFVSCLTGYSGKSLWEELGLPSFVVLDIESNKLIKIGNID